MYFLIQSDVSNHQHDGNEEDAAVNGTIDDEVAPMAPIPRRRPRVRRNAGTVAKNIESLNAPLDTITMPDPLFSRLNSIAGDIGSSSRLLLSLLPCDSSSLKMTLDHKYWDASDHCAIAFNADNHYEVPDNDLMDATNVMNMPLDVPCNIRRNPGIRGYTVTDAITDDEEGENIDSDEEMPAAPESFSSSISGIDFAFDMNAAVEYEPPRNDTSIGMNAALIDLIADEGHELDADDRQALEHCRSLQCSVHSVQILPPTGPHNLEYSYQPLDRIRQFWAGPSYWKYLPSRARLNDTSKRGTKRKRGAAFARPIFVQQSRSAATAKNADENVFLSLNSAANVRYTKSNVYRKFDTAKMKLPKDFGLGRDIFDTYEYAPGAIAFNGNTIKSEDIPYAYELDEDIVVERGAVDNEMFNSFLMPDQDDPMEMSMRVADADGTPASLNGSMQEIFKTMEAAPQMVSSHCCMILKVV